MKCVVVMISVLTYVITAFGQIMQPGTYTTYTYTTEQLLLPPNDIKAIKSFQYHLDTVWDFRGIDTIAAQNLTVIEHTEQAIISGSNLVTCYDDGDKIDYWHQTDSSLILRASMSSFSITKGCTEISRFKLFGIHFGNGESFPDTLDKLYSTDQFEYNFISYEPGYQEVVRLSHQPGIKYLDVKMKGTIMTPFDTLDCWLLREKGFLFESESDQIEYEFGKYYCIATGIGFPLMTKFQWKRPLSDTIGHYVNEESRLLKFTKAIEEVPEEEFTTCLLYPNPFQGCIQHQFDDNEIQVLNGYGQPVRFESSDNEICLDNSINGMLVVIGQCNGRQVAKPVLKVNP